MGCGCGGSGGGSSEAAPGVLLSGSLDGQYSTLPGGTAGPSVTESSITGATVAETVSNGGFWIVLIFVIGAAWYLERIKKENE